MPTGGAVSGFLPRALVGKAFRGTPDSGSLRTETVYHFRRQTGPGLPDDRADLRIYGIHNNPGTPQAGRVPADPNRSRGHVF